MTAVIASFVISTFAHFAVGAAKSLVTTRSWWASGLEMTIVGVIEAAITYGLGVALAGRAVALTGAHPGDIHWPESSSSVSSDAATTALLYPAEHDRVGATLILAHGAGADQRRPWIVDRAHALSNT